MNISKNPLFLTENWALIEEKFEVNKEVIIEEKKITISDVLNEILTSIQEIVACEIEVTWNKDIDINSVKELLASVDFDFENDIELEETITVNEKIIFKYKINKSWEKKLKSLLIFFETNKILQDRLYSWINFESLNKKLNYINSDSLWIKVSEDYTEDELIEILNIVKVLPKSDSLVTQLNNLINKIANQPDYKDRLLVIINEINNTGAMVNWSKIIESTTELNTIYQSALSEAQKTVNKNFSSISYTYTEKNTEFIESKQLDEQNKTIKQQEKLDEESAEKLKLSKIEKKKKFYQKLVKAWIFAWFLATWGIVLDKFWTKESIQSEKNNTYENEGIEMTLINRMIEKDRVKLKIVYDKFIDDVFKTYDNPDLLVWIIWMQLRKLAESTLDNAGKYAYSVWKKSGNIEIKIELNSNYSMSPLIYEIKLKEKNRNISEYHYERLYQEIQIIVWPQLSITTDIKELQDKLESYLDPILYRIFGHQWEDFKVISYQQGNFFHIDITEPIHNVTYDIKLLLPSHLR